MCTGGRLIADFVVGGETRPDLPASLERHLTTTVSGLWVVWAHKVARPAGDVFIPLTHGSGYPADAQAECRRRRRHNAPDPGCTCGFHALSTQVAGGRSFPVQYARRVGGGVVGLSVALSGRVLAFEWRDGGVLWRAARQTVARIERPDSPYLARDDIEMRRFGKGVTRIRRDPDDPDGRPAVISPVAPRDSGPIRLDLPASAAVVPVNNDDAGWCAVPTTSEYVPRSLVST